MLIAVTIIVARALQTLILRFSIKQHMYLSINNSEDHNLAFLDSLMEAASTEIKSIEDVLAAAKCKLLNVSDEDKRASIATSIEELMESINEIRRCVYEVELAYNPYYDTSTTPPEIVIETTEDADDWEAIMLSDDLLNEYLRKSPEDR